jgi:hypothetical protein
VVERHRGWERERKRKRKSKSKSKSKSKNADDETQVVYSMTSQSSIRERASA